MTEDAEAPRSEQADAISDSQAAFLSTMYGSMWDNINRHITVLWQSAGVLATAFGAALLIKRELGRDEAVLDVSTAVVIGAACWLAAHAFDAANWINRNIQIISNIEAEVFRDWTAQRRRGIHPYMGAEYSRPPKMLLHTKVQLGLSCLIGSAAYLLHWVARVAPTLGKGTSVDFARALPTVALLIGVACGGWVFRRTRSDFAEFLRGLGHQRDRG